jgi:protoporphyrinogen oxidase
MKVCIIGGGYLGLTTAYELLKAGKDFEVEVYEKEKYLGGLTSTFSPIPGAWPLEQFYHHIFASDTDILDLIEELGLTEKLIWSSPKMGVYAKGKIFNFATAKDAILFSAIPLLDRIRFGLVTLYLKSRKEYAKYEHILATEWIKKYYGEKVHKTIWEPLIKSKFSEYADKIGMAWFWGRIKQRGTSRKGKFGGKEVLGYLEGSFQTLTDVLADSIKKMGGKIFVNSPVEKVVARENKIMGIISHGRNIPCDIVVSTIPTDLIKQILVGETLDVYAAEYEGMVCPILILKESLSHIYWMNVADASLPFCGIVEHTNLISKEHYKNKVIVYLARYVPHNHPYLAKPERKLISEMVEGVKKVFPKFSEKWVEKSFLMRQKYAQPILTTGYKDKIPSIKSSIDGLYLSNMAQIYPEDRGTNFAVKYGKLVAKEIVQDL